MNWSMDDSDTVNTAQKAEDELAAELERYFTKPRQSCKEISPEILRLYQNEKKRTQHHRLHILKDMLKRAEISKVNEKMQNLIEFDKSDSIVPHGEVSKRLYNQLCQTRPFDLYGRRIYKTKLSAQEEAEAKLAAKQLGLELSKLDEKEAVKIPNIFEDITGDIKPPAITTAPYKIGYEEVYNPPVGFSSNHAQPMKSYGHEKFFAYDGDWEKGKMCGTGVYQYIDGYTYKGSFRDNCQQGEGIAAYANGSSYEGEWHKGKFGGKGVMKCRASSSYEGYFFDGRRNGYGKLKYASGLTYEGDFVDGKPHGRGTITSVLTGYSFEGTFNRGSIEGSGVLTTPPPECKRFVQYWREAGEDNKTLPSVVRYVYSRC